MNQFERDLYALMRGLHALWILLLSTHCLFLWPAWLMAYSVRIVCSVMLWYPMRVRVS